MVSGNGTAAALSVEGASCDPKTLKIIPGANACLNDAPWAKPAMAGLVSDAVDETETEMVALTAVSPLYAAVTLEEPCGRLLAATPKVAVAEPPDPVREMDPNDVPPTEKTTLPVGVVPSVLVLVTVAVRKSVPFEAMVLVLAIKASASVGGGGVTIIVFPVHACARL